MSRSWLCIAVLVMGMQLAMSQTVTNDDDVIAILGVGEHDYHKFCKAEESATIQWFRDGEMIDTISLPDDADTGEYFIDNDDMMLEDAGQYSCSVVWVNGSLSQSVPAGTLTILESDSVMVPSPQYAVLGQSYTLQCSVAGVNVITRLTMGSSTDVVDHEIETVTVDDEGEYNCRLSHAANQMPPFERMIDLQITVIPEITGSPDTLYSFTGDEFNNIVISFRGRDDATTSVTWARGGLTLPASDPAYTISEAYGDLPEASTTLTFTPDSPLPRSFTGEYTVIITNSNDVIPNDQRNTSHTFSITVTVLPAIPTNIQYMVTNNSEVARILWEVNYRYDDEKPDSTIISVKTVSTGHVTNHTLVTPTNGEVAVNVVPGEEYLVVIMSSNRDGEVTSQPFTFNTDPAAPAVVDVITSRINMTAFNITAELAYTGGGAISHFTVSFRIQDEEEWNSATVIQVQQVSESDPLRWTGIVTSSEFDVLSVIEFQVLVQNENGLMTDFDGMSLSEIPVLPAPPLSIEAVSTTESSAVLEITLSPTGTAPLTAVVELTSHPEEACCPNQTTFTPGDTVRITLEDLEQDTTYTVYVYAVNLAGQGSGTQDMFSTDGATMVLELWQIVLIGVCGALFLVVLVIVFCLLLCCGCKASRKWGRKEYHAGPIEVQTKELDRGNPMLTRGSIRSNGYASSNASYGPHHLPPLTPRTPTVTSPAFDYIDGSEILKTRLSTSMSPFHTTSQDHLTGMGGLTSSSHGNLFSRMYHDDYADEPLAYQSLPREGGGGFFSFGSPSATLSPPPAPKAFATDV